MFLVLPPHELLSWYLSEKNIINSIYLAVTFFCYTITEHKRDMAETLCGSAQLTGLHECVQGGQLCVWCVYVLRFPWWVSCLLALISLGYQRLVSVPSSLFLFSPVHFFLLRLLYPSPWLLERNGPVSPCVHAGFTQCQNRHWGIKVKLQLALLTVCKKEKYIYFIPNYHLLRQVKNLHTQFYQCYFAGLKCSSNICLEKIKHI